MEKIIKEGRKEGRKEVFFSFSAFVFDFDFMFLGK